MIFLVSCLKKYCLLKYTRNNLQLVPSNKTLMTLLLRELTCCLLEGNGWNDTGRVSLKSKVKWSNMAAGVTSHSCQVWGTSSPWHVSNPSYLKLSPPASQRLIPPDTSHNPDRESLYPENNPAPPFLSSPNRQQPPYPSVRLPYISLYPLPPYLSLSHYFSLWPTLSLVSPSVYVKLYSAPVLSRSSFPPPCLPPPSALPRWVYPCLCWWESVKRRCDCRLRNSLHFLKDSSAFKNGLLLHCWMLLKLEVLISKRTFTDGRGSTGSLSDGAHEA